MRELVKIVCVAVSLDRDDSGNVVGEVSGEPTPCYSADQLQAYHGAVLKELAAWNAEHPPPNRAQRRAKGGRK